MRIPIFEVISVCLQWSCLIFHRPYLRSPFNVMIKVGLWSICYLFQGPRKRTIMGPITRNNYYASRNKCPIMEWSSRNRSPITVYYYEKKALLRETKPIKEKLRLKYSFKLQVNELREGVKIDSNCVKPLPKISEISLLFFKKCCYSWTLGNNLGGGVFRHKSNPPVEHFIEYIRTIFVYVGMLRNKTTFVAKISNFIAYLVLLQKSTVAIMSYYGKYGHYYGGCKVLLQK